MPPQTTASYRRLASKPAAWLLALATSAGAAGQTGLVYDRAYLTHDTGAGHPERAERLTAVRDRLEKAGLLSALVPIKAEPATMEQISAVHTAAYIEHVHDQCRLGPSQVDSADTTVSAGSFNAAVAAAGGVLAAVDAVMTGQVRNAFCLVRPPGHHALKDRAMGFCLFNNVAIAARHLQQRHRLVRVLIVDWDVHHGNGTQAAFYGDDTVFYFSVHQSPFYPGTGGAEEQGEGAGRGFTLNVPLPAGSGDAEYRAAFEQRLAPAAAAFRPDFVLVSAGFDAARGDLLGRMSVTPEGFASITRIVRGIAERHCAGRLVSVLEGGYALDGLAASAEAHVRALMAP